MPPSLGIASAGGGSGSGAGGDPASSLILASLAPEMPRLWPNYLTWEKCIAPLFFSLLIITTNQYPDISGQRPVNLFAGVLFLPVGSDVK